MAKAASTGKAPTKGEILTSVAEAAGISRKQAAAVFESLTAQIQKNLSKKGPGLFTVPGLMKLKIRNRPATKARNGINPFTKEPTVFKAKPARRDVKIFALKSLKDSVK